MGIVKLDYISTNPSVYKYMSIIDGERINDSKKEIIAGNIIMVSNPQKFNDIF